jgi:iron complex outermembrane receptor protein
VDEVVQVQDNTTIILRLEHHAELLEEIELQAQRIRESVSAVRNSLDREAMLRSKGTSLGVTLESVPGVNVIQTGPAIFKPVINGLHSHRILILKDGLRLESQQWGLDHAPEIDPNTASSVGVVKGTAAVQYGADAVGGVILVESEELPDEKTLHGSVHLTGIDNGRQGALSVILGQGLGNGFSAQLRGTLRRAGDARAADYLLTNTGLAEQSLGAVLGYRRGLRMLRLSYDVFRTELGIMRSAHIGSLTDLYEALQRDQPFIIEDFSYRIDNPRQYVLHQTAYLSGQTQIRGVGIIYGQYAVQWNDREEYDIRRGGRGEVPSLDLRLQTHTALVSLAHEELLGLRGKVSLNWNYQQNRNTPGTGVRPLIPHYTRYLPSISWVEKWTSTSVEIEGGMRYEYQQLRVKHFDAANNLLKPVFHFHNLAWSAGLRYAPSGTMVFNSHLGFTRRAPHVNELFSEGLHHGAAAIEEGDQSLSSERAVKWVNGLEWTSKSLHVTASAFVQSVNDFIYLRPTGTPLLTVRGAFPVFKYVQDDVTLYGGDIVINWQWHPKWQWSSELAMLRSHNRTRDEDVYGIPSDRMRHTLRWRSGNGRFEGECSVLCVGEQSRAPDIDYAPPPDGYALLQLGAGWVVVKDRLQFHATVRNLLNTAYREYLNRLRYYADDVGRSIELRLNYTF